MHLTISRILKEREISIEEQHHNEVHFGVRYPSAISEAIIKIASPRPIISTQGPATETILLKVDSGASVSLAHSDYLSNIGCCKLQGLPPVRLSGIGGKTEIMDQVGMLTILNADRTKVEGLAYSFDTEIGDAIKLCLLSTYAIDKHKIDQQYHNFTSLRIGPQILRYTRGKPRRAAHLQKKRTH